MSARRRFLMRLALGSAAVFGWPAWGARQSPAGSSHREALELGLALRIVHAAGAAGLTWPVAKTARRPVAQLLATVLGSTTVQDAARLDLGQLRRLLAQRIEEDYRKAALVQHRGWWLAHSEAAILELGCRVSGAPDTSTDALTAPERA